MKQRQFRKWLESQGVTVTDGTRHLKLRYQGKSTILPRHPNEELTKGTMEGVKKQIGRA